MSTKRAPQTDGFLGIPIDVMWSKPFRTMSKKALHVLFDEIVERTMASGGLPCVTIDDINRVKAKAKAAGRPK